MRPFLVWPFLLAFALAAASTTANEPASLVGQLSTGIPGLSLRDAGAIVVFLENEDADHRIPRRELPAARVHQVRAEFEPPFLAVATGQTVEMPNEDIIYHNVFSYSKPNDFDLGLYAAGESRSVRFDTAGLVRIYCSIHEAMDGLIFVAPNHLFSLPDSEGRYEIGGLPVGRYLLHVWSERLPERVLPVEVSSSQTLRMDLELGRDSN
jgi:plastocyanin